ncbi:MAG: hypothetical protein WAW07_08195, partial [Bacteroidales bacterium]
KKEEEAKKLEENAKKLSDLRRNSMIKKYGSATGEKILSGKIWLGMTDKMAKDSWGDPEEINRTIGSWGVHEQWVYYRDVYLYFENGILTSWQD